MLKILIIERDKSLRESAAGYLSRFNYSTLTADTVEEGLRILKTYNINLVFIDAEMNLENIAETIDNMKRFFPSVFIVILGKNYNAKQAVEIIKHGAYDYLVKPLALHKLAEICNEIEKKQKAFSIDIDGDSIKAFAPNLDDFTSHSTLFKQIIEQARLIAKTKSPVLLTGPTGSGKGVLARAIHKTSDRKNYPFVDINCSAIPETLFESECFGHEAGAFTDALSLKKGLFETADRGTIFLDEIGNISPLVQLKLLKVLDEQSFYRLGGNTEIKVDVRIIASTNCNLPEMVQSDLFRSDLYFRLALVTINVPSLKDRAEDIIPLANEFIMKLAEKHDLPVKTISDDAVKALLEYEWPGGIRELKNVIERVMITSRGNTINKTDFPSEISGMKPFYGLTFHEPCGYTLLSEHESHYISEVLKSVNGNRDKAAKILGIARSTLFEKIRKYNIQEDD